MGEKYIYINENSLSKEICHELIYMYENQEGRYNGVTFGGLDKNVKDTVDFLIPTNPKDIYYDRWNKIHNLLVKELSRNIQI